MLRAARVRGALTRVALRDIGGARVLPTGTARDYNAGCFDSCTVGQRAPAERPAPLAASKSLFFHPLLLLACALSSA
jgi:hypothetical protein